MKTDFSNRKWTARYPELGQGPISPIPAISPEFFETERNAIFRQHWLNVCSLIDLPEPGDFFVRDIKVAGVSILLVHGKDGMIRGFHNVCSHRGNKVVWERKGKLKGMFVCQLHCWSYDAEGKLRAVPDEENFYDIDKAELGLTPVATEVFEGFVFVNLAKEPPQSLAESLGEIATSLKGAAFHRFERTNSYVFEDHSNWKVALDAQNESYHIPFQHRYLMKDMIASNAKGMTRLQDVCFFGPHSRVSAELNPDYAPSPLAGLLMGAVIGGGEGLRIPMHGEMVDTYLLFPNFHLIVMRGPSGDSYVTYNYWPEAVDRTSWEVHIYASPARNAAERVAQEMSATRFRAILDEDAGSHEAVQTGLASGAKSGILLQDEEIQIRHFHRTVEDLVAAAREPA